MLCSYRSLAKKMQETTIDNAPTAFGTVVTDEVRFMLESIDQHIAFLNEEIAEYTKKI